MNKQIVKRICVLALRVVILIFGLSLLTFVLVHFSPIDPVRAYLGAESNPSPEQVARLRMQWGLDEPMFVQFFAWFRSFLSGDFGYSRIFRAPVLGIVLKAATNSCALMMVSWVLSGVIGYFLGVWAAFKRNKVVDRVLRWYSYTLVSIPSNVMALFLLIIFGVWLKIFPIGLSTPVGVMQEDVSFAQRLHHFILPCLTLTLLGIANAIMYTRTKVASVLNSDYVLFARARGESNGKIFKYHVLRNSVVPVLVIQFASFSELFAGSALAENVFAYHGLGSIMTQAGLKGDLPLLLGAVILSALFVVFGNFIADVLTEITNPKTREVTYE